MNSGEFLVESRGSALATNDTGFTTLGSTSRGARKAVLAATGFVTLCIETLISTGVVIAQGVVDSPAIPPPLPLPEMPLNAAVTASPISATAEPTIVVEGQPPGENSENPNHDNSQEDVSIQQVVSKWWLGFFKSNAQAYSHWHICHRSHCLQASFFPPLAMTTLKRSPARTRGSSLASRRNSWV